MRQGLARVRRWAKPVRIRVLPGPAEKACEIRLQNSGAIYRLGTDTIPWLAGPRSSRSAAASCETERSQQPSCAPVDESQKGTANGFCRHRHSARRISGHLLSMRPAPGETTRHRFGRVAVAGGL